MVFVQESMRVANLEQQKACLQVLSEHMEKEGQKYEKLMSKQVSSCKISNNSGGDKRSLCS